ncbi:hypothetical protein [Aureimonas leprariae]|uniref:hypothetical protein n=1 Tax=Plantimonas leprariae TaxID=2615207 RepID=UPI0013868380|nr:hypothetical protein [Aureimonas leprariae]
MHPDHSIRAVETPPSHPPVASVVPTEGGNYRPIRCRGDAVFPSAMAVDVARLLDVDPAVEHWRCRVPVAGTAHVADFGASGSRGEELLFVVPEGRPFPAIHRESLPPGARFVLPADIDPVRLENARAILPFARWRVSLDDRIRLLAALDEEGSVTLAECLGILRNTSRPIAAVASLALARFVDLDLDEPIGSRTRVIRREA